MAASSGKGGTVLILGGGVGGIVAANRLAGKLAEEWRILVVDQTSEHIFAPSLLWVLRGTRQASSVRRPLRSLLRRRVELEIGGIDQIDLDTRRVNVSGRIMSYDYLVTALGASLNPGAITGLAESGCNLYTLEGCLELSRRLESLEGGSVAVLISATPYKCPGAPHEAVMLIDDVLRRRGIRNRVDLHLFTPEPQPLPVAGPALGANVRQLLESKGIAFHAQHKFASVSASDRMLSFENQESFRFDLLAFVPPHSAPAVVHTTGLANESGWIPVDRRTLRTSREEVYAIGDVASIPLPGRWKPDVPMMLPKAGVFAHAQALIVADEIAARVEGKPFSGAFYGEGFCMLEAGEDVAGFAFGDFFGEPSPRVQMHAAGATWHYGKVLFEKWWLSPPGAKKSMLGMLLRAGAKLYGAPLEL